MKLVKWPSSDDGRRHEMQDPRDMAPEVVSWIIVKAVVKAAAEVMTELDGLAEPRR